MEMESTSFTPEEETEETNFGEVEVLKAPLRELLIELCPAFERGEFDLIIGDDASGRVPSLIIWEIAKQISVWNNVPIPQLKFAAGSRNIPTSAREKKIAIIEEHFKDVTTNKKKLIVTEHLHTGKGLSALVQALRRLGCVYEVATVYLYDRADINTIKDTLDCNIHWGARDISPGIFGSTISGVEKKADHLFATKIPEERRTSESIHEAHSESLALGNYLAETYINEREQDRFEKSISFQNPL